MENRKNVAILLAAGRGSRMGSETEKQFLELGDKPLLYYSLKAFETSEVIDQVIIVTNKERIAYVEKAIVSNFHFTKVTAVIPGGSERYLSVWGGLKHIKSENKKRGYVFIHDSARALINTDIVKRAYEGVREYQACVVGMPAKDTIKIAGSDGFVESTPSRDKVWIIQTPQVFTLDSAYRAYEALIKENISDVTDDAMVVEKMLKIPIKLIKGSYENIKITTPEDLKVAESILEARNEI